MTAALRASACAGCLRSKLLAGRAACVVIVVSRFDRYEADLLPARSGRNTAHVVNGLGWRASHRCTSTRYEERDTTFECRYSRTWNPARRLESREYVVELGAEARASHRLSSI